MIDNTSRSRHFSNMLYQLLCIPAMFFFTCVFFPYDSVALHRIDILVNNFGIGKPNEDFNLVDGSEKAFFDILELNLGSVYRVSKLVVPHMIANNGGSIVNISSIGGLIPDITRIGYGVSKAAVNNITKQIALQYKENLSDVFEKYKSGSKPSDVTEITFNSVYWFGIFRDLKL